MFCPIRIASLLLLILSSAGVVAQKKSPVEWVRPSHNNEVPIWGIKNGIVFGLSPTDLELGKVGPNGGPRGLIRIGYRFQDKTYLINFLAIEPIVKGQLTLSELAISKTDNQQGMVFWSADSITTTAIPSAPPALGKVIRNGKSEILSVIVRTERFSNGAHPYLKISINSAMPNEIGIEVLNEADSEPMQQCTITATMGNYGRLRLLALKDEVIDSRKLYSGFPDNNFVEKHEYSYNQLKVDKHGDLIAIASQNESLTELKSWPNEERYLAYRGWAYRLPVKLDQYWRKPGRHFDPSLRLRVNGRLKYWAGNANDPAMYIDIPGGLAFENFELRERYYPGQQFFYGLIVK
ncbi:hypothetical protein EZ449_19120 [Pedobacter frigidisoli]|uniref:Uncharacterized protein n=1 Tax=Pedobacter frigidisoli TaxID=2530455 RepID=A0A4R0NMR1_9SPHI|nr:hypothetical protein [Pedobacter frigidisoli]TCD02172.1 hypothetical protein EZ449_19120 [Pedobacter frigidisoli]